MSTKICAFFLIDQQLVTDFWFRWTLGEKDYEFHTSLKQFLVWEYHSYNSAVINYIGKYVSLKSVTNSMRRSSAVAQ